MSLIDALAKAACEFEYEKLSPEIVETAKLRVLDGIGVGLHGSTLRPLFDPLIKIFHNWGGEGTASVFGEPGGFAPRYAAAINSVIITASAFQETHRSSLAHPYSPVMSTALAVGEEKSVSGKDFLLALVAGYEIYLRVATAVNPTFMQRGIQTTGGIAPFGAAAVCATAIFAGGCASDDLEPDISPGLADRTFYTDGMEEHLANARAARGRIFLTENEARAGIQTRPSGLQFEVLEAGDGAKPTLHDTVVTHYKVSSIDGTLFDDSEEYGEPQEFRVDKVIAGWREALQEMREGGKWKLYVPPQLAYGDQGLAQIPGGETLIYELELLTIKRGGPSVTDELIPPVEIDPEPDREISVAPDQTRPDLSSSGLKEPGAPAGRDLSLDNLDLLD